MTTTEQYQQIQDSATAIGNMLSKLICEQKLGAEQAITLNTHIAMIRDIAGNLEDKFYAMEYELSEKTDELKDSRDELRGYERRYFSPRRSG